jgi:hypothetical protein
MFYGPGMDNFDIALHKMTRFSETRALELRFETFNTFNHAQFLARARWMETSTARHLAM